MKRTNGSVTLFTAMIFLMVVTVITTTIKAARVKGAMAVVGCAASMALDSLFAEYDSELFSEFGVLLFDGKLGQEEADKEEAAAKLWDYMSYNLNAGKDLLFSGPADLYGIIPKGVTIEQMVSCVDYGGLLWQEMVVEYEKYAKPIDMAADYLGIEDKEKEADEVDTICQSIMGCTETILQINEDLRELVGYIDGIQCDSSGIDFSDIKTTDSFLKKFCPAIITPETMNIDNHSIYLQAGANAVNVSEKLDEISVNVLNGDYETAKINLSQVRKLAKESLECTEKLNNLLNQTEWKSSALDTGISALDEYIEKNSEYVAEDVMDEIEEEIDNLKSYKDIMAEQVCDVSAVQKAVNFNNLLLREIIDAIDCVDFEDSAGRTSGQISEVQLLVSRISFDGLHFNYANLAKSKSDTSILDSLMRFLDTGILAMVLPSDAPLSSAVLSKPYDMASNICDYSNTDTLMRTCSVDTKFAKDVIYTEYVMDKFSNFRSDDNDMPDSPDELNYQAEYIIFGENSDVRNLTETVLSIAAIRSGFNMVYLLTDTEKKEEAYAVALTIAGASGMEPLIRLVQFALLYLWAYAEGLADVKTMLGGGKVPVAKTEETWKLSLEKLLSHSIDGEESESEKGMTYEGFIRFLLFSEDDGKRAARTMDLVEMSVMSRDSSFRMKDMIYAIEMETAYALNGLTDTFQYKAVYTY